MLRVGVAIAVALLAAGCQAEPTTTTVPRPETPALIAEVDRPLVFEGTRGAIEVLEPGKADPRVVLPLPDRSARDIPTIHALSGPDDQGRIAYLEDHFFVANERERRHALKSVQVDGTADTEYFTRPGDAMWAGSAAGKGEIGRSLALAPRGGNVALLSHLKPKQMPQALLNVGRLEIWNLDAKTGKSAAVTAIDEPMAWFPDGQRLVYAKFVRRDSLPKDAPGLDTFGQYFGQTWPELPCLHVFDLATNQSEFFSVGWQAVVSPDGATVYVGGWGKDGEAWIAVDAANKSIKGVGLPGQRGPIVGATAGGRLIYWAYPTEGRASGFTRNNSPLSGPKQLLTIKVADPATRQFATLLPSIDPRNQVSYGGAGRSAW